MERVIRLLGKIACYIIGGIVIFLAGWILRGVKARRRTKGNAGTQHSTEEVRTVA